MLAVRKALGVLVSLIALAGVVVTVVLATRRIDERPRTDDAYLQADLVHMAPDVSGRIVQLDVRQPGGAQRGRVVPHRPGTVPTAGGPGERCGGRLGSEARARRRPGRVGDLQG